MRHRFAVGACLTVALLASGVIAADNPTSGPQVGKGVSAFHPLNVTGARAGQKNCLV